MSKRLDIAEFRVFRDYLQKVCGLRFPDEKYGHVAEVVVARMSEWGMVCFRDYLHMLTSSPGGKDELSDLAVLLTVGETYFFRNKEHWRAFEESVVPLLLDRSTATGHRHIRIWSAGCSTGEEAYTAGIVLKRSLPDLARWSVEIIGTDINPVAISAARTAIYTEHSFRGVPPEVRGEYFEEVGGGRYRPCADIRKMACFHEMNLFNRADMSRMSEVDVVFCRNVLIYFDGSNAKAVIAQLHRSLRSGGYLFLGHAEHLHGHSQGFVSLNVCDTFIYRSARDFGPDIAASERAQSPEKEPHRLSTPNGFAGRPGPDCVCRLPALNPAGEAKAVGWDRGEDRPPGSADTSPSPHRERPAPSPTDAVEGEAPLDELRARAVARLCTQENVEAQGAFEEILEREPDDMESLLGTALLCASSGDSEAALKRCERVLRMRPTSAEAFWVMALVHESLGAYELSQREFEKAVYLDGEFSIAHFRLAGLYERLGRPDAAARALNNVLKALPDDDEQRVRIYSGGFDKGTIRRSCERRLGAESSTVQEINS